MSENGKTHESLPSQLIGLLEDQIDLAALEWQYEKRQSFKRAGVFILAVCLAFAAFILLQVALVTGIASLGISVGLACLILGGLYAILAGVLFWKFARRDPRVGTPFQGTRQELKKNLEWIQQLLS